MSLAEQSLIDEIRNSLSNRRLLDVVSFGGVEINGKIVALKNRLGNIPKNLIEYNKPYNVEDLEEIRNRNVVFGLECFGKRGLIAMLKLSMLDGEWSVVNDVK